MRVILVLAGLLALSGCEDMRAEPPPIAEIELSADGGCRLDGRLMASAALDRELSRQAADAPNEKLGRTRLQVRIRSLPGVDYARVLELQERCQALGISNVEIAR
ncbi:MAG TPA: hypothetical protein DCS97_01515 [Planctomycetes bacterium]|nr:hypothetical protein [Planctomycetota bacterium]